MQFVKPTPFEEAVDKLGERTPMGSAFVSSEWKDVPVALRERAFFSSQVENARFLQRAQDAIAAFLQSERETLPDGQTMLKVGSRAAFVEQMREFALSEGMGPIEGQGEGGLRDITSERRLGLIFNTQVTQANSFGYYKQGLDPDVLNEFPGMRFIRVAEVKEPRHSHEQYENQVYLKGDPIWERINEDFGVPWAPFGWGCQHDTEDVDRDECEALGLVKKGERIETPKADFNEGLEASTSGLEPDLIAKLKGEFGSRLEIEGERMRWAAAPGARSKELGVREPRGEVGGQRSEVGGNQPVSDAVKVKASGMLREYVRAALAAIDGVHDDGVLPEIELLSSRRSSRGYFQSLMSMDGSITANHVGVRSSGDWPALTTVHELGHFLDLEAIGGKGKFSSRTGSGTQFSGMRRVLEAAEKTDAIRGLRGLLAETRSGKLRDHYEYLLDPAEVWARAYAQFIAETSGNKTLEGDLVRAQGERFRQWSAGDFEPVSQAIKELLVKLGWI